LPTKVLSGAALIGAFVLLLVFASPSYRQGEPGAAGRKAPEFTFLLDGKPTSLSSLNGKVIVLNFWATWCPPCVDEMPSLNRLHARLQPVGGMVLGVSVDEDAAAYENFLREYGIGFPNLRDPAKEISQNYGSVMYPETYILTVPKGGGTPTIQRKIIGPQEWDRPDWFDYLQKLAAQQN
jgi:cytochrome c biogenesis protein CcmG/thiol:disulfide interchange protein DsbE